MMLRNEDGTYDMGRFDVLGILKDTSTGRFHACLWLEHPLPGVPEPDPELVRLKSKMHHTVGADTFEGAVEHVKELHLKVKVSETNLWIKPEQVAERDFNQQGYADVLVVRNWLKTAA
jgi:hypothetical protein